MFFQTYVKHDMKLNTWIGKGSPPNFALILSEFKRINFYSPRNYQKTVGFLIILEGVEVN